MIKIIIEHLPYLGLVILGHSLLGIYNNVIQLKDYFSWNKLLNGINKAFIITTAFIIVAVVFDKMFGVVELGGIELAPDLLLYSVILMYLIKMLNKLKDIFKLDIEADIVEDNDLIDLDDLWKLLKEYSRGKNII